MSLFTNYQLAIIQFCAEECARQKSGEASVEWMINAYNYAAERFAIDNAISEDDVVTLLKLIEPEQNRNGYRHVPVSLGDDVIPWEQVARGIANVLEAQDRLTPTEFYTELEKVHPGIDGNGRLGAILFQVKNGTLWCPVTPPDVFKK